VVQINDDGSHEGEAVVSFNETTRSWKVLCPAGHLHRSIPNPLGIYGIHYWRGRHVECDGYLSPDRRRVAP
jgi:hypothetical protein